MSSSARIARGPPIGRCPTCCHRGLSSLEVPGTKGGPPVASGRAVAVNVMMTARLQTELRGGPDGPKQYCPPRDVPRHPIGNIRHIFHTTAWLCEHSPYAPEVTAVRSRLITTEAALQHSPRFGIFGAIFTAPAATQRSEADLSRRSAVNS